MKRNYCAVLCIAVAGAGQSLGFAATYSVQLDNSLMGNLKQGDVPAANGAGGPNSCAPAAVANGFAYLQNAYGSVYGSSLAGNNSYSALVQTGTTLASSSFMNTSSTGGTTINGWLNGEKNFLELAAPGKTSYSGMGTFAVNTSLYPWFSNADPTFNFLYSSLQNGASMSLGMLRLNDGLGHVVTLTGLNWNDSDSDGMLDRTEQATMSYIDPGDGLAHSASIWQVHPANPALHTDYFNVGQDTGVLAVGIGAVPTFGAAAVPEVNSLAILGIGAVGLLRRRRV